METPSLQPTRNIFAQVLTEVVTRLRIGDWVVLLFLGAILVYRLGDGTLWFKPDPNAYLMYVAPQRSGELKVQPKRTRDIGQRLQETDNDIAIFWGSQSGVSERFAERLSREWRSRYALKTMPVDLDDYDPESLATVSQERLIVFLVSTYGEGDPPDNAVHFFSGLEKMQRKGFRLDTLRYCAMGMGNRNYKYYNRVIEVLDETLSGLGAQRIGPVGRADESLGTTEESFMDWKAEMLETLKAKWTIHERPLTYEPSIEINDTSVDPHLVYLGELSETELHGPSQKAAYHARNPYGAPITVSRTLSSTGDRVCMHMELDLSAVPALRYQSGDHLAIWPVNPETEVDRLMNLLGLHDEAQRRQPITITARDGATSKLHFPSPTTREALLKNYLEICGLPSRDLCLLLAPFAPTSAAREALLRLGQDKEAFRREVVAQYLTVGKVMERIEPNATWKDVPFSLLVENFPRIQPRRYSISSSPLIQPRQPSITMVINNHRIPASEPAETENTNTFFGLATNFLLAHHRNGEESELLRRPRYDLRGPRNKLGAGKVYMHIQRSAFKLPSNPAIPIIMVGAGTGIAPFRGFVQERARLVELGKTVGTMVLFFGCRDDTTDYLYREEWQDLQARLGDLFLMVPAFSRLPGRTKTYVHDALEERKDVVSSLMLRQGAAFYICGAATMARQVRSRLVEILAEGLEKNRDEADAMIGQKMKKAGLYHEDVW